MKILDTPRTKTEARKRRHQLYAVLTALTVVAIWVNLPDGERVCGIHRNADGSSTPADFRPAEALSCSSFVEIPR